MARCLVWFLAFLVALAHPRQWRHGALSYPQLWYYMPRRLRVNSPLLCLLSRYQACTDHMLKRKILIDICNHPNRGQVIRHQFNELIRYLCGRLTGHEASKTECGTSGKTVHSNCRWCDTPMVAATSHPLYRKVEWMGKTSIGTEV